MGLLSLSLSLSLAGVGSLGPPPSLSPPSTTTNEFRTLLSHFAIPLSDADFDALVRHIDVDGDGTIDKTEFFSHFGVEATYLRTEA